MEEIHRTDYTKLPLNLNLAREYRKTQTIRAMQINTHFTVETKEGRINGKPGDYLAVANDDSPENPHRWIIDESVFRDTYEEAT